MPRLPPLSSPLQVDLEKCKNCNIGNDCLMSINGTDFRIPQTGKATTNNWFASHKYAGKSALRYKIGVSILGGDLVWIQGPYPAGQITDIKIFNKILRHFLEPGKRVEADNSYVGATNKIECLSNLCNPIKNKGMQSHICSHYKTINGWFKMWGILKEVYHYNIRRHGEVFWALR
jgi:hypothetical protein